MQGAGVGQTQPRYKTAVRIDGARPEFEDTANAYQSDGFIFGARVLDCFYFYFYPALLFGRGFVIGSDAFYMYFYCC